MCCVWHCCRGIEIFQSPCLLLVCTILVHKKLINCLRWHPQFTAESESSVSPCRLWLASASNESVVHVYNLDKSLSNGDLNWSDVLCLVIKCVSLVDCLVFNFASNCLLCEHWLFTVPSTLLSSSWDWPFTWWTDQLLSFSAWLLVGSSDQ